MFAQTPSDHTPRGPFIILSVVESTNNYAMAKLHVGLVQAGACFLALEQTAGKGQRGRGWQSGAGQNITLSIILPSFPHISFPFLQSAVIALACYDFIKIHGIGEVSVKWPNDIYIGDRKAAGILVENVFRGSEWRSSVAGIGMNVNQEIFPEEAGKPVSLKQVTGNRYNVVELGRELHRQVTDAVSAMENSLPEKIMETYNARLYRRGQEVKLKKGAQVFTTRIRGVSPSGELLTTDTLNRAFAVGEVEFL